jgi:hypothetical protein
VDVEELADAVLRLDVMPAIGLRAVDELDVGGLAHPRHRAQPLQLVRQVVVALDRADENPVLLVVIVLDRVASRLGPGRFAPILLLIVQAHRVLLGCGQASRFATVHGLHPDRES